MSMAPKHLRATDKEILAMPSAISDKSVARNLGVSVERVEKVRGAATTAKLMDGRRKIRADEPIEDIAHVPGDTSKTPAGIGSAALLAAHLVYHRKHNAGSSHPPLAHAGVPR